MKFKKITNKEKLLDVKENYLMLQRLLIKNRMYKEMKQIGKNYENFKKAILEKISGGEE